MAPFVVLGSVVIFGGFMMLIAVFIICREKASEDVVSDVVSDHKIDSEESQSLADNIA